jgi:MFS family permease
MGETGLLSGWAARVGRRFAVLRLRDLRFVFGSTLVSGIGDGTVGVALAFAVLDLMGSATDLGIVMAARTITMIVLMLFGGVVADRMSRRTVMMAADLVRFGSQLAIGALLLAGGATVLEIVVSQVLVAAGESFFQPASSGMIQAAAGERTQEANALRTIAISGSGIIGPAIGGVLVASVGGAYALIADGVSYLLSALLLAQVRGATRAALDRDVEAPTFLNDLRAGFHEVVSRTWLWAMIVNMALGNLLMAAYPVLGPLICKQHYGGAPAYAALSVASAVGMLVGGSALLRFKPHYPMRFGVLAFLPVLVPGILLGLHAPIYIVGFFQFLGGAGMTIETALWWTAMQENVGPEMISRVSSYDWAGTLAVMPIGYALVGPLANVLGDSTAIIACSGGALVVTMMALLVRDIRMLESKPASGPGSRSPTTGGDGALEAT